MAISLPLPLKIAAGLVVSGVERIRSLPGDLTALPVQAVGYALRVSMKVQQEIAELATKGDETLGAVFGGAPPERSPLATFDDDLTSAVSTPVAPTPVATRPAPRVRTGAGGRWDPPAGPAAADPAGTGRPGSDPSGEHREDAGPPVRRGVKPSVPVVPPGATIDGVPVAPAEESPAPGLGDQPVLDAAVPGEPNAVDPNAVDPDAGGRTTGEATAPAPDPGDPDADGGALVGDGTSDGVPADWSVTRESSNGAAAARAIVDEPTDHLPIEPDPVVWTTATDDPIAGPPVTPPLPLPDYDRLTVAQVRGHLRRLTADDVQTLLEHERGSAGRAPFLTLLSNRLVTLQHSS